MSTRSITCPTCSHGFAVPADARTAICPKCGRALPILAVKFSFTGDELPPRRKAEDPAATKADLAPRIARIPLKRRETRLDDSVDTGSPTGMPGIPTTPTAERPAPIVEKHRARPAPRPPPLPAELRGSGSAPNYDVAIMPGQEESRVYAVDTDGRTGVDLPHRPQGSGIDPSLPPSEETERAASQLDDWRAGATDPGAGEAVDEIGDGDIFEVESGELPAQPAAEHIIEDEWPTQGDAPDTLTGAGGGSAAPLPPLLGHGRPPVSAGEAADVPDDPTIPVQSQARTPVPAAVLRKVPAFHRDRTPSARMRALSSVIEDEVTGQTPVHESLDLPPLKPPAPQIEPVPEPQAAPSSLVPVRPSPSSLAPLPDQGVDDADAPMNLPDTGIVVLLPQSPVEELGVNKPSQSVQIQLPAPAPPAPEVIVKSELAPITRRPRAAGVARGQGVALKEGVRQSVELPWGLIVAVGLVVLLLAAIALYFVLR